MQVGIAGKGAIRSGPFGRSFAFQFSTSMEKIKDVLWFSGRFVIVYISDPRHNVLIEI